MVLLLLPASERKSIIAYGKYLEAWDDSLRCFSVHPVGFNVNLRSRNFITDGCRCKTVINVGLNYLELSQSDLSSNHYIAYCTAALRGIGETKIPMKNNIIANSCNVLEMPSLIYVDVWLPSVSVTGAAISAVSNLIAMVLNTLYFISVQYF